MFVAILRARSAEKLLIYDSNMNHDMNDSYDLGCEMERKRLECAIYLKAMDKICAEEAK